MCLCGGIRQARKKSSQVEKQKSTRLLGFLKKKKNIRFKGGSMDEIADGQVWAESNVDGGPALFWFGFVHEDAKRVVAW
jgi:hypothetical protein